MTGHGRRLTKLASLATLVVLVASGCASNAPQTTLEPQGPQATSIHHLLVPVLIVAGIVFVLVIGGAIYVVTRFRAVDEDDFNDFPEQVHGNFKAEIGWTIAPAVLMAVIGVFTVFTLFNITKTPGKDALQVQVYGQQWWWEYRYDTNNDGKFDDVVTANDLVIPEGRTISLHIRSRDVIHSWWAPALNGKKDAVPGRTHPLTIKANHTGEFIGQCTEFCGLSHAEMRIKVVAVTPKAFDDWVSTQQKPFANPEGEAAIAGWKSFAGQCTSCHRIDGMTDPADVTGPADADKATKVFKYPAVINQRSGAAPNLTKFMSRTTFAGAKFDLRKRTKACEALGQNWAYTDGGIEKCLNRNALEAWLRNAPGQKAMAPGDAMTPASRGMPNLNLTEDQIDQLVAFLSTLK